MSTLKGANKFESLSIERRHKHAARELRKAFEGEPNSYSEIEALLNLEPCQTREEMADRYHFHLKNAWVSIKEHTYLDFQTDRLSDVPFRPISIYLDKVRSAHNIGSILRTIEAFRLGSIVLENIHPKVAATSMGCSDIVPCTQEMPRPWIALETTQGATPIDQFAFPKSFTLILGNEEYGVSQTLLNQCDIVLQIPLVGGKNSLNVSNAFAIAAMQITSTSSCSESHHSTL